MKKYLVVGLLFFLFPVGVFAQHPQKHTPQDGRLGLRYQDLPQTYIFPDRDYTLNYPEGWVTKTTADTITFANTAESLALQPIALQAGQMQVLFVPFLRVQLAPPEVNLTLDEVMALAMEGIAQDGDAPVFGDAQPFVSTPYETIYRVGTVDAVNTLLMVMRVDEENFLFIAASGDVEIFTIAPAMVASLVYDPNADTLWQVQRSTSTVDSFGEFYDMTLAANGNVYVAMGLRGIQEVDQNGNVLRHVQPDSQMSVIDMAVNPDGRFWVVDDFNQQLHLLGAGGNIIFSFGDEARYQQIELGANGYIYAYGVFTLENTETVGIVQIYTNDGGLVRQFQASRDSEGFTYFTRMRVGADGKIYLADLIDGMRVFNSEGVLLEDNFLAEALGATSFTAIDVQGAYLTLAVANGKIYTLDIQGNILRVMGKSQTNVGGEYLPGELATTVGVVLLPSGDVIAADTNFSYSQILRFSFSGL